MSCLPQPRDPVLVNEPKHEYGVYALEVLRSLRPMNVVGRDLVRCGGGNDGGYVMLDDRFREQVVYSLGIANDVAWDAEMANFGCPVYQYDYSIEKLPFHHANFHFEKFKIGPKTLGDNMTWSLLDLLKRNGHESLHNIILKMDIEDAEWDVFHSLDSSVLSQFSQILVEMHCFTKVRIPDNRMQRTLDCLRKLNETHQVVHVHANNWGWVGLLGGVFIPDTLEVSYVRRADHSFDVCRHTFPTPMDQPCDPASADFFLGALGLI